MRFIFSLPVFFACCIMLGNSNPANANTSQTTTSSGTVSTTTVIDTNSHGYTPASAYIPFCTGGISLCGITVSAPTLTIGAVTAITQPLPYQHLSFTVQCLIQNGLPTYQIINAPNPACQLESCYPSTLSVCGTDVAIPQTTPLGKQTTVTIPVNELGPAKASNSFHITAQCVDDGSGTHYQVANGTGFSCSQFPCADSQIQLCGSSIPVPGGAAMGTILHMNMPQPFAPDPFTVQCVGSQGNAPTYQIVDHDAVTCALQTKQ